MSLKLTSVANFFMSTNNNISNPVIKAATAWSLIGFILLLGYAIYRLFNHFLISLELDYYWYHWLLLSINTLFMAYSEGYKGFQKSYSLKFVARIAELKQKPTYVRIVLAPLFCMNYFEATRKNTIIAYVLTVMIILLIVVFSYIPQPWRGILDFGVVVGLSWGLMATLIIYFKDVNN